MCVCVYIVYRFSLDNEIGTTSTTNIMKLLLPLYNTDNLAIIISIVKMFEWFGWVFGPPSFPAKRSLVVYALLTFALLLSFKLENSKVRAEILTPPYFNLAEGRKIYASATCGEDSEGSELYCKLVGANAENDLNVDNVIQGQVICDFYAFSFCILNTKY